MKNDPRFSANKHPYGCCFDAAVSERLRKKWLSTPLLSEKFLKIRSEQEKV